MSLAVSASAGKTYGLARVAGVWEIPRSAVYGQRKQGLIPVEARPGSRKRGPKGPCGHEELVALTREELAGSPFHGEGYRQVWDSRCNCTLPIGGYILQPGPP